MQSLETITSAGDVLIDTGLVWLDAPTAQVYTELTAHESIARICGLYAPSRPSSLENPAATALAAQRDSVLNFYGDLLLPLAESTSLDAYLSESSEILISKKRLNYRFIQKIET